VVLMNRFDNKIILVTGAAQGQGAEEARRLHAEGATVLVTDLVDEKGRELVASLGERASYAHLDVSKADQWERVLALCERQGGLDGLVNNAGVYRPRDIPSTDEAIMRLHFEANQLGVALGMRYAIPHLQRRGGGSIVNISSTTGLQGIPNHLAYAATKWAVRGMTKVAAIELAPLRIRVNSVHPGLIDTSMLESRPREDLLRRAETIPLGRMGTCSDVAGVVLFLLSDESAYMTGAELSVDGGISL
jgi:3alpha(or 20beta)-hydroxysteroid dehydrogenase